MTTTAREFWSQSLIFHIQCCSVGLKLQFQMLAVSLIQLAESGVCDLMEWVM